MELKQRKLFNSNKFLIRDGGLEWTFRENFNYQNTFFEFEEMNFKKATKYKKYNLAFIILSTLSLVALCLSLIPGEENSAFDSSTITIFLILSITFIGLTFFFKTDNIYIPTDRGAHIIMYNGLPTKQRFSSFLETLKSKAKQSLMEKYFVEGETNKKELYRFLNERGLLDESEKRGIEKKIEVVHRTTIKGFGKD